MARNHPDPELAEAIGNVLRRERKFVGLSVYKLAKRMTTSRSTIQRLEAGEGDVMLGTLRRFADELDLSIVDLVERIEAELER